MTPGRRIDVFLQYYLPHVSGLTNVAVDLAEHLAKNGFEIHVHASGSKSLLPYEVINGVHVHRARTWFKLGRAAIAPGTLLQMLSLRQTTTTLHLHLPYPEAGFTKILAGKSKTQIVTYQCDSAIRTLSDAIVGKLLDLSHRAAIRQSTSVVVSSFDYARNSRLADLFASDKTTEIPPTIRGREEGLAKWAKEGKTLIGFLGRPTSEKGLSVLVEALGLLPDSYSLVIAGPTEGLSESVDTKLIQTIRENPRIHHLGLLDESELKDFYASLDVFVLPSTNSFEAFGIVQVEAMFAGVPVIASNIPGVRTIVQQTGFGEIFPPNDSEELARKIRTVATRQYDSEFHLQAVKRLYGESVARDRYLQLLERTV